MAFGNKLKKGGAWESKIFFDPEADDPTGDKYDYIEDEELIDVLTDLVGYDEEIIKVYSYKTPLTQVQLTRRVLFHQFIVFETESWWWSIEKDGEGLIIQRSKTRNAVQQSRRGEDRHRPIELMKKAKGEISVHDLIEWLYRNDELNKAYNLYTHNCQHFANAVYDQVV